MCNFMSFVVTKGKQVFYSKELNQSHENIIKENNLNDIKTFPNICRIEIVPKDDDYKIPIDKWMLKIDQEKPEWWNEKYEKLVLSVFKKVIFNFLKIDCDFEIKTGFCIAIGKCTVKAYDSSTVKAYGSSTVTAYNSSTVKAYDSSTVTAYNSSTVKAYSSSTVKAYDSSTVKAYGSSIIIAELQHIFRFEGKIEIKSDKAQRVDRK